MAKIEIYTKATCPYCHRAKALLSEKGVAFQELPIDGNAEKSAAAVPRFRRFLLMHSTLAAVMTCTRLMRVVDSIPCCANALRSVHA